MSCLPLDTEPGPEEPQRIVAVDFEANDGSRWQAIGGGRSLDEAIAYALQSTPAGRYWRAIRTSDLYGD